VSVAEVAPVLASLRVLDVRYNLENPHCKRKVDAFLHICAKDLRRVILSKLFCIFTFSPIFRSSAIIVGTAIANSGKDPTSDGP
jgi:hypothetical protein